ncbi:MAG: hypothetical protein L6V85_08195 [Clostridiales bacterium]|nr:MAG: hypothetical protein L6V85_08195 [Clostridiales bacterium]
MLTLCMSVFIGAGSATAFAYDGGAEAIPCEHEYIEQIYDATCTEKGYTEYVCELCGESYKDNFTDVKAHNYSETKTEPTCTKRLYNLCLR